MTASLKTTQTPDQRYKKLLWMTIGLFCIVISALLLVKYNSFGYNAIDLGIYNQVFFNSAQGQLFAMSIHPHLYLGDHFEIFILFLLPIYYFFQSPFTLLVLQTVFVALSAWPLYLIARTKLSPLWSWLIGVAFLLNPITLNLIFFEFHLLPFAILPLLFAYFFYLKNKFIPFILWSSLAVLVREDVGLVVIMFGVLALIDKKNWRWIFAPIILGGSWFLIAIQLTGFFNPSGGYKFIALYSWLGATPSEILINFLTQPWRVLKQLLSINNLIMSIAIFIPLIGLPLLRAKHILPVALIILQIFLIRVSATIVLQTHYLSLVIPFLYVAAIFALANILAKEKNIISAFIYKYKQFFGTALIVAIIYSFFTFTPIISAFSSSINYTPNVSKAVNNEIVRAVQPDDTVVASFDFLPALSARTKLYSLHYAFLGRRQFSDIPYTIPSSVDKLVIDFSDFIIYYLQSKNISSYAGQYSAGADRINQLIKDNNLGIRSISDSVALYEKNYLSSIKLTEKNSRPSPTATSLNTNLNNTLILVAWEQVANETGDEKNILPISFYWRSVTDITDDYFLQLLITDSNHKKVYDKIYPLGYGLYPTSQWTTFDTVKTNYWFYIPPEFQGNNFDLSFQVVALDGYMGLDEVRSTKPVITKLEMIGEKIPINYSTL